MDTRSYAPSFFAHNKDFYLSMSCDIKDVAKHQLCNQ